jgi:hypothetical protein
MKKQPPKNFTKLASAPTLERLTQSMTRYFCGEEKELRKADGQDVYTVHSQKDGRQLSTQVVETTRGFYFGYFE